MKVYSPATRTKDYGILIRVMGDERYILECYETPIVMRVGSSYMIHLDEREDLIELIKQSGGFVTGVNIFYEGDMVRLLQYYEDKYINV